MIAFAVGERRPNRTADVRTVQQLLNRAGGMLPGQSKLDVDGNMGPLTSAAIKRYQQTVVHLSRPDGVVDPGGRTITMLSRRAAAPAPAPRAAPAPAPSGGGGSPGRAGPGGLSEDLYVEAASQLGCEVAAIKAVVKTEVDIRGAFDTSGRPTILFERHKFYKHTNGRFAQSNPDICNSVQGGYGRFSEQYPKLDRAIMLDRPAALKSASWGAFQILGENHVQAGHSTVESFVAAMKQSVAAQLKAFVAFVRGDGRLLTALRTRNWATFARIYNGPGYAKNQYDQHMRSNYQRFAN
ncbi:N-acetylmuramidase family protein [Sphingomonas sp. PP-CE-1G-424]|uniref:N-acetylmuramidase domain-containing protein n=1 Tax=Sphingomonas sp. PP-CE-1G-424 TaxID=2135658 RepID=UPI00105574FA|nr:N-acetylmuramidase family protein [Sphingomonas sp. PP-CE-1G-424]TCP70962.1 peptidoglycan hydrolase-like protein with peptidoglycan-binding domain [Sphingomonas sp. PP-CE-1G-424]